MTTDEQIPPMSTMKLAAARMLFKNKSIFLIDDTSMLGPIGLGHINQRMQEITGCYDLPFGGKFVILTGDASQLQPVASKSLYCSAQNHQNLANPNSHNITPSSIGSELFSRFSMFELTEQMRTTDATQIKLINQLRDPTNNKPIDDDVLKQLIKQ